MRIKKTFHAKRSWIHSLNILACISLVNSGCGKTSFGSKGSSKSGKASDNSGKPADPASGGDATGMAGPQQIESFSMTQVLNNGKVDVVVLFDTSGSMLSDQGDQMQEVDKLRQELPGFVKSLKDKLSTERFQLFLVMDHNDLQYQKVGNEPVFPIDIHVDSNDQMERLADFLDRQKTGQYQSLQEGAALELIMITDDNAEYSNAAEEGEERRGPGKISTKEKAEEDEEISLDLADPRNQETVDFFNATMEKHSLAGRVRMHGMVFKPGGAENAWCTKAGNGTAYIDIAAEIGGTIHHLCDEAWDKMLEGFSTEIETAANGGNTKVLSKPAFVPALAQMSVEINGKAVDSACYKFDETANSITVEKSCLAGEKSAVKVTYIPKAG